VLKQRGKGVREMCVIKVEVKVQKRRIRGAVTHQNRRRPRLICGGVVALILGSLAAV
jgi:hypothetical protein